jgi:hypothetical protein
MPMKKVFNVLVFVAVLVSCNKDDDPKQNGLSISGIITEKGQTVNGITVRINGAGDVTTGSDGKFELKNVIPGSYTIEPIQQGRSFLPDKISVDVSDVAVGGVDFILAASDQLIHKEKLWDLFKPSVYFIKTNTSDMLQLDLNENALWYHNSQGGLVSASMTGNFTITATVNAVRKSNNSQPVACSVCLGGLMVRNPATATGENYVHLVTGFTPNGLGVEFKSTTNSNSVYNTDPDGSSVHDLRIQRVGSVFNLYQKLPTESTWTLAVSYTRTDLPQTVLVGLNIYTAQGGPVVADLSMLYQSVTIEQ